MCRLINVPLFQEVAAQHQDVFNAEAPVVWLRGIDVFTTLSLGEDD